MEGFEITYNGQSISIELDELTTILINHVVDRDSSIYVGNVNYTTKERKIWNDFTPLQLGDRLKITFLNINKSDPPQKNMHESTMKRPISDIESFYKLESLLKEKGLL